MLSEAIDALATQLKYAMPNVRVTRDPSNVIGPCVFIDYPLVRQTTLAGFTLEVPVYLVAAAPGDIHASDWLLATTPDFLHAVSAQDAEPRPLTLGDTTHPAVNATAVLTVRNN